ncbi:cyanophycinase [Clostridium thermobutyricum]|jgi:cyanophycinase|uniref:Cyanophycinase n=1 Tax=Clostridium thermobutyricum TaxID=29372 RepID=N9WDW1_9CLOT|nr:cyanophycinase [Clostridium thermobutyricum]ENZ01035.1 cyanophycinase [Clostridium thermobutyricum]
MDKIPNNKLIIIGGAEDKKGNKTILKEICKEINNEKDLLVVMTVASEVPLLIGEDYLKVFKSLGVKNIKILNINSREEANLKENIEFVKKSKLIFFTGGDQLRITSILGGTEISDEILSSKDKIFVGTSAGASVMSGTMIIDGEDEESPKKSIVNMSPGLGFLNNVVIDQHFAQRGRIGRLLTAVAEHPGILGIGIDENTAIVVTGNLIKVIGNGSVYVIDGDGINYTNISAQDMDKVLSIFNVKLHVLISGNSFDLKSKIPFEEEEIGNENNKQKSI